MGDNNIVLGRDEEILLALRSLFRRYGYAHCRVSAFESYDFYAKNRSFLSGEDVLTFTDTDGKLMALKPDVTMSIIKNTQEECDGLTKLYYNENVYRPSSGGGFREIVQTGLECIGQVDSYAKGEVVMLACKSLHTVSDRYLLDVSHIGIVEGLLDIALPEGADPRPILKAMEEKNLPALDALSGDLGMDDRYRENIKTLTTLYGPLADTLPTVVAMAEGDTMGNACSELAELSELLQVYGLREQVHLDFSIPNSADYYSGLLLQGYVNSVPCPVLCGGQYDKLVQRMGKKAGAIGFAVYLDQLERTGSAGSRQYDVDTLLLYGEKTSPKQVAEAVSRLSAKGETVRAERQIPRGLRYKTMLTISDGGVINSDGNA